MNKQDLQYLFDKAYNHITKQGRPSLTTIQSSLTCVYRSDDGCGCAAAPFILNYDKAMEFMRFAKLAEEYREDLDPLAVKYYNFVTQLQGAHDSVAMQGGRFLPLYIGRMQEIARKHDLTVPA